MREKRWRAWSFAGPEGEPASTRRSPGSLRPPTGRQGTLWQRLEAQGFDAFELDALRALLAEIAATGVDAVASFGNLMDRGADLDRLLVQSGIARTLDAHSGLMLGYQTHRVAGEAGAGRARQVLGSLRTGLADALGDRGLALAKRPGARTRGAEDEIRAFVKQTYETRVAELEFERRGGRLDTVPFAALTDAQIDDVRRAVRRFAERLRGAARVRTRRARRGRVDPHHPASRASHGRRPVRDRARSPPSRSSQDGRSGRRR